MGKQAAAAFKSFAKPQQYRPMLWRNQAIDVGQTFTQACHRRGKNPQRGTLDSLLQTVSDCDALGEPKARKISLVFPVKLH